MRSFSPTLQRCDDVRAVFYYKKADYGFARVVAVLVRLNLLPVILAVRSRFLCSRASSRRSHSIRWTPTGSPTTSARSLPCASVAVILLLAHIGVRWYLLIYAIMWTGNKWNGNLSFMLGKIATSIALIALFFHLGWPLEALFGFTNTLFGTEWNAREWTFRVTLDLYIPFAGMLAALATIKVGEHRLLDHASWSQARDYALGGSGISLLAWFLFEHWRDKFAYNRFHPFVSLFPVTAFALLRNATPTLRSTNSQFFAYIGRISLETFIVQFHLWLAADTHGLLVLVPGASRVTRAVNFVVATIVFLFVSVQIAKATGELTDWICGKSGGGKGSEAGKKPNGEYVPLATVDAGRATAATGPETTKAWMSDLRVRFGGILLALWILNLV